MTHKAIRNSKRILVTALACGLLASPFGFPKSASVSAEDTTPPKFSFGVISDFQFTAAPQSNEDANLKNALTKFKENNIKVLMCAGDISNAGEKGAYEKFNRIFDEVYTDPASAPKKVMVMGNHDYWNGLTEEQAQKLFCDTLNVPLNTNITVDGYHFIGVSTEGSETHGVFTEKSKIWLKAQLDAAQKEDPNKPIFVMFHQHVRNTVYLSDAWGNDALDVVLKDYPQIITFSGHSHAVLDDERSIHQKDYTSVGTSTLSYTELEYGKVNGSVPPRAGEVAQGLIVKVKDASVDLERYDFHNDCKIKTDWVVDLPVDKADFRYSDARIAARVAPAFPDDSTVTAADVTMAAANIEFNSAVHDDFVQSYRIKVTDTASHSVIYNKLFFSDFYLGLQRMAKSQSFKVDGLEANKDYQVDVTAIESFGKESSPISTTFKTPANNDTPLTDVFKVDFADGTGKDTSSFNAPFTLPDNAKIQKDSTLDKNVLALDGSCYVNYAVSDKQLNKITDAFTLEAVFMMNSIKGQAIAENCQNAGIGFESTSSGLVELWAHIGGSYQKLGVQLDTNQYYHLAATYDGKDLLMYLDGKLVASKKNIRGSVAQPSGVAMCLGGDPDPSGNASALFDGYIALVRVMNKAISAEDIVRHYNDFYGIEPDPTEPTTVTTTTDDTTTTTLPTSDKTTTPSSDETTTTLPTSDGTTTTPSYTMTDNTTAEDSTTASEKDHSGDNPSPATGSTLPLTAAALGLLSVFSTGIALKSKKK